MSLSGGSSVIRGLDSFVLSDGALLIHLHVVAESHELIDEVVAAGALTALLALIVARGAWLLPIAEQWSEQLRDRGIALEKHCAKVNGSPSNYAPGSIRNR